jgi:RNA polymerase sigma-70 factor (ECF subfamily)
MMTAGDQLDDRNCEAVYRIAVNMCATARQAEEVFRQALLAAWLEPQSLRGESFTTWLYRIAIETALAHRERDLPRPSRSLVPFLPAFDSAGHLVPSGGRWPGNSCGPVMVPGLLREALEFIDDRNRAVFVLRDLLDVPVDEVAAIMRSSPEAVRRDAHRVRLMLRGFIDQL